MKKVVKIQESELKKIITECVKKCLKEDMSFKHNGHNYDDYLDDVDFLELANRLYKQFKRNTVCIEDFEDENFRENLIDDAQETVMDFVADEAVNNFGYKYGENHNFRGVGENLIDFLEDKFK